MQPRAVEYGEHNGVAIHVRSTFNDVPGTIIREEYTVQEKNFVIRGVAHDTNVAKIAVRGVSDEPGIAYKIFSALAEANIDVDMIVQSASATDHKNDILFTVTQTDMVEAMSVIESLKETMHFDKADIEVNVPRYLSLVQVCWVAPVLPQVCSVRLPKPTSISTLSVLPKSAFPAWCRKRTLKPL